MATYAFWNNKGGVGKSYLTYQVSCEYARTHPEQRVLVIDLCPQANVSGMLLGGIIKGESVLEDLAGRLPRQTIAGYISDRITSPYLNPYSGSGFVIQACKWNDKIPGNLYLVSGDDQLEIQGPRVLGATDGLRGPPDAWRIVHTWVNDLIEDIQKSWDQRDATVFIDCNPSFSIYTELAMSAADRLIIPFSADGSSRRAVRTVLSLLYGVTRQVGSEKSQYFLNSQQFRLPVPKIYCYVGNRLTQYVKSAQAFKTVVTEIGNEIWEVWRTNPGVFLVHPAGASNPLRRKDFAAMFQYEVVDANSASVVSSALGIPIVGLRAGKHELIGKTLAVNQCQLDTQQPNIQALVAGIE